MEIKLTKHVFGDVRINHENMIGTYGPKDIEGEGLSDNEIRETVENPVDSKPLREMAKGCKDILIVTDDNTRATPLARLLPPILDELKEAGVHEDEVTFLIALGTHRPMTRDEIKAKFGTLIAGQYQIVNHAWDDPASLISLGSCEFGFDITINKLAQKTDLLISVGSIVPHATTGFSGGGKTIMPGICGEGTIEDTHWMALDYSMSEILGTRNNPIQKTIHSICKMVKLRMIVNTVLFNGNKIFGLVTGELEHAHQRGIDLCCKVYGIPIPQKADIVIAEAYPTDIDLRQSIKAICTAELTCRNGGVIILPADCPEGVAPQFPEFSKYGFKNPDRLYQDVKDGKFKQKLMAYTLVAIGRIISRRARAILVSPNIEARDANKMGFEWTSNLQEAVDKAFRIVGKSSKVIVLKQAGELLPIMSVC